jgi:3,4-dihydroxy 2-butanone 4-phosphate synthase
VAIILHDIEPALADLRNGRFVLVFDSDSREGETDFVMAAQAVTPDAVRQMRKDGGGLVILMVAPHVASHLGLPFLSDLFASFGKQYPVLEYLAPTDIPYDTKSSFSLYINHRKTFTGITDQDRSLTIKAFAQLAAQAKSLPEDAARKRFGSLFRTPGHVPVCVASKGLVATRKGHTELAVALMTMAGCTPIGCGCEMMGDAGKALPRQDARHYAEEHHLTFLEGADIIEAWNTWSK